MREKKLFQDFKSELVTIFKESPKLLNQEKNLLKKFQQDFHTLWELPENLKIEAVSIAKNKASIYLSENSNLEQDLIIDEIFDQEEILNERFGSYADKIKSFVEIGTPYDERDVMSSTEYKEVKRKWWSLQYYKINLFEEYIELLTDQDIISESNSNKVKEKKQLFQKICNNYRTRYSLISSEEVMFILRYADLKSSSFITEVIRTIQRDPKCPKGLKEDSQKNKSRIRRVIKNYDKETDNDRSSSVQ